MGLAQGCPPMGLIKNVNERLMVIPSAFCLPEAVVTPLAEFGFNRMWMIYTWLIHEQV
jgi:hypothetical protein